MKDDVPTTVVEDGGVLAFQGRLTAPNNGANNDKFDVYSGALEYENEEYSILKIVADNIEGGLQTIQGRLKRYEKDI